MQRWLKLSKYILQFGWKPVIYTPLNPEVNSIDESLLLEVSPEIEVLKRKITEPYAIYKFLSGKKKNEHIKENAIESSNSKGITSFIRGNLFIPDPRVWWVKPSVRFLKEWLSENKIDAIISTGPPHSMHLIARELHNDLGVPWVADFRDPWTRLFYFKHLNLTDRSAAKHRSLELSILSDASKVVTVTSQIREDYVNDIKAILGKFATPEADDKVVLIENGYDPADFDETTNAALKEEVEKIDFLTKNKFVVAHTGLLTNSANPPEFWKALGEFAAENQEFKNALQVVVLGQTDNEAKECFAQNGLDKLVLDLGYSPHPKAVALQKRANLLLLPLRKEPEAKGILTGKLFEYLASGSPIIAFGYKGCELEKILNETSAGVMFEYKRIAQENNCERIKKEIERVWAAYKAGAPLKNTSANISKYSRSAQAEAFAKLLDKII